MKVSSYRTRMLRTPADDPPMYGQTISRPLRDFLSLELMTDEGIDGVGISFFGGPLTGALKKTVDTLCGLIVGDDPMRIEAIVDKLRKTAATSGPSGMFTLGLAAIDIALWDIKGKALSQPVSRLLGGYRERLPTYASGALLRNHPFSHLEQMGPRLVEMGFKQMKAQAGADASVRASGERIRVMRQAIGPDIDLMVDINQLWNVHQAIEGGKYFEECNLFWMEDPVAPDDYQGLARVADALTTPIATGEYVYGITPFRQMLEQRSLDIVMVDVVRAGGITQFMKIAGMAQAFNLPVVSHLVPEIQVHLISAIPNGLTVEYMPWTLQFWEETPQIENGQIVVPDKPGLGLNFDQKALAKYEVK